MVFPSITGIDMTGACHSCCDGGQPCCDGTVANTLYCTLTSDCAEWNGEVVELIYNAGTELWEGLFVGSIPSCDILINISCAGGTLVTVDFVVNGGSSVTSETSDCDPPSIVVTATVSEESGCCPGSTVTGTITE